MNWIRAIETVFRRMLACGIGLCRLGLLLLLWGWRELFKYPEEKKISKKEYWICHSILILLQVEAAALLTGYFYLAEKYSQISVDQLVYHAQTDLGGTNWGDFTDLFVKLGISIVVAGALGIFWSIWIWHRQNKAEVISKKSLESGWDVWSCSVGWESFSC